jgi:hypothetical protein
MANVLVPCVLINEDKKHYNYLLHQPPATFYLSCSTSNRRGYPHHIVVSCYYLLLLLSSTTQVQVQVQMADADEQRCRGERCREVKTRMCRGANVMEVQVQRRCRGAGADVQMCRLHMQQRCRGAEVQRC